MIFPQTLSQSVTELFNVKAISRTDPPTQGLLNMSLPEYCSVVRQLVVFRFSMKSIKLVSVDDGLPYLGCHA